MAITAAPMSYSAEHKKHQEKVGQYIIKTLNDMAEVKKYLANKRSKTPLFSYHIATTMNARARAIQGTCCDSKWFLPQGDYVENIIYKVWSNQELRERSGEDTIRCEIRDDVHRRIWSWIGDGIELQSPLDRIESGDESIYLTTQELQYTPEDEPLLLSSPAVGCVKTLHVS